MSVLVERFLAGDRRALARLISLVENERPEGLEAVNRLHGRTGRARIVGFTGPPGAGKSTLVDRVARELRRRDLTLGIVAVDPTSPFSGGAILGDRIRMNELSEDRGVFIRSMGTRGALGGLALATENVINLLDAFGKDVVIVETVGVGQSEVDIVKTADTSVVVEVPGLGDGIQAIKAGIFEIGDLFVVNKADRDGTDRLVMELTTMLHLGSSATGRIPPVLTCVASSGTGVDAVVEAVLDHWRYLEEGNLFAELRTRRRRAQFGRIVASRLQEAFGRAMRGSPRHRSLTEAVLEGRVGPFEAAGDLVAEFTGRPFDGAPDPI